MIQPSRCRDTSASMVYVVYVSARAWIYLSLPDLDSASHFLAVLSLNRILVVDSAVRCLGPAESTYDSAESTFDLVLLASLDPTGGQPPDSSPRSWRGPAILIEGVRQI